MLIQVRPIPVTHLAVKMLQLQRDLLTFAASANCGLGRTLTSPDETDARSSSGYVGFR